MDEKTSLAPHRLRRYLPLVIVVALALVVRVADLPGRWLWYDELQSVTHAGLPPLELIKSVLSFDPHPPLYYGQLHVWMLLGAGDAWIKLNSVLWSVLTVISVYVLGRELVNAELAIVASLLFAISPFAVSYAQEARMYTLLMFLGVWSFYFTYRFFTHGGIGPAIGVLVFTTAFLYSHGAGFMLLVSLACYAGLVWLESKPKKWRPFLTYAGLLALVLALYLPWLLRASTIRVGHTHVPTLADVVDTLFILLAGRQMQYLAELSWAVVALAVTAIAVVAVRNATVRGLALAFLLAPILFGIVVSYASRPIWIYRTFAYTMPFLSLVLAETILSLARAVRLKNTPPGLARAGLVAAAVVALAVALVVQQRTFTFVWNFRDASAYLRSHAEAGDVIYVPSERVLWGLGWYLAGPRSIQPRAEELSALSREGVKIVSTAALGHPSDSQRYWLVYRPGDDIAPFDPRHVTNETTFNELVVAQVQE